MNIVVPSPDTSAAEPWSGPQTPPPMQPVSSAAMLKSDSELTHHDHTRAAFSNLPSIKGRFDWSFKALFAEIPLLKRNRASKPSGMGIEQDDIMFYAGYTHGLWSIVSKFMSNGLFIIICMLSAFLAYRIADLLVGLRAEEAAKFLSVDDQNRLLSDDRHIQNIFADIKWISIEGSSIVSFTIIYFLLRKSRAYHCSRKASHASDFPHTPLKAVPFVALGYLSFALCVLSHTGLIVQIILKSDSLGNSTFTTTVFGHAVFSRNVSPRSMFVLAALSDSNPSHVLEIPYTKYLEFDNNHPVEERVFDFENSFHFTKWMISHVAIGFRLGFLFFLSVLLPLFMTPRWREVCKLHAVNCCCWFAIAVAVFLRYSSTPVIPAIMLVISLLLSFLISVFVTIMLPLVAALLYEQSQVIDSNRKELFRWSFHEVRVPCTAILSGVNMLASNGKFVETLDEETRDSLFDIALSTRQLSVVLNNVLEWERSSKLGMTLNIGPIQLGTLLRETLGIFTSAAKSHDLRVAVEFPQCQQGMNDLELSLDQQKMHHIILNMMSNCIKYARTNITVHVSVLPQESCSAILASPLTGSLCDSFSNAKEDVSVHMTPFNSQHNSILFIQILDDGPGMSSNVLQLYSQEFGMEVGGDKASSIRNTGTGLGAHISGRMLQAHGGQLFLRSSKGIGTAVTLQVPLTIPTWELQRQASIDWRKIALQDPELFLSGHSSILVPSGSQLPQLWLPADSLSSADDDAVRIRRKVGQSSDVVNVLDGKNILLVEDDKLVSRVLGRSLSKQGAHVWMAMNGSEALCMLGKVYGISVEALTRDICCMKSLEDCGSSPGTTVRSFEQHNSIIGQTGDKTSPNDDLFAIHEGHGSQPWLQWAEEQVNQPWKAHQTKSPCPERFDVVLTDMNMPQLSGLSVCEVIRQWRLRHTIETVVVGLTGNALDEDLQLFMQHGAHHALAKPLHLGVLQSYLRSCWPAR